MRKYHSPKLSRSGFLWSRN